MENREQQKAAIEAILFTMGDAVEVERLASCLEIGKAAVIDCLKELMQDYEQEGRGIMLLQVGEKYQLCTKTKYYETLIKLCHIPQKHALTDVLLETLSIIAYKQPVTKQEIESIRGVKCDFAVNKLMEYHLVCELGRMDAPGRPILFGTTDDFLRCFGVSNIEDLPVIAPEQLEEFKLEAEEEADVPV